MPDDTKIGSGRCHGPGCRTGNAGARLAGLAARGVECGTSCPTCGAMLRATADGDLVDEVTLHESWKAAVASLRSAPAAAGASSDRGYFSFRSDFWGPARGTIRMEEGT